MTPRIYSTNQKSTGGICGSLGEKSPLTPPVGSFGPSPAEAKPEKEDYNGSTRVHIAPAFRSRRPLWPPNAPLEPTYGSVYLWPA